MGNLGDDEKGSFEQEVTARLSEDDVPTARASLEFGVDSIPPAGVQIFYALQIVLTSIGGSIAACYVIHISVCGGDNTLLLAQLISTSLFMVGITTFCQVTFGVRLPITQGSSMIFLAPVLAMMDTDKWKCPDPTIMQQAFTNGNLTENMHMNGTHYEEEPWLSRLCEISGALAVASAIHIIFGLTGFVGYLTNFIGPLTVTPCLGLIGIMLYKGVNAGAQHQWGIALLTAGLMTAFALRPLANVRFPVPSWSRKNGWTTMRLPIFRIFASNLALAIGWLLCLILTVTDVFPNDPSHHYYQARTDAKISALKDSTWFYMPYPGQWGSMTLSAGGLVGMMAAVLGSIVESIGDYYATARVCEVAMPPKHAVNRAVFIEGMGSLVAGVFGAGHATTSYSSVIGYVSCTGMGSRRVWQVASIVFIIGGIWGKFGAVLAIVPAPVISGIMLVSIGMVFAVAISNLSVLDMESGRNQMILGVAVVTGVCLPMYCEETDNAFAVGNEDLTQVAQVVLSNGPLVAGFIGFVLDNIVPGTLKERGIFTALEAESRSEETGPLKSTKLYDLPWTEKFQHVTCLKFIPLLPCYESRNEKCCKKGNSSTYDTSVSMKDHGINVELVDKVDVV